MGLETNLLTSHQAGTVEITSDRSGGRPKRPGNVYFISDGTAIKIGYAGDVEDRLSNLQSSHPMLLRVLASFRGDTNDERLLHSHFQHLRIRGEWFRPDPLLTEFIADVAELGKWIPHRVTLREALADGLREAQREDKRLREIRATRIAFEHRFDRWRREGFPSPEIERAATFVRLDLQVLARSKTLHKVFVSGLAESMTALERALGAGACGVQ